MEKDELDFVSPARREMVRRRLTAVRRYMANPHRAEADRACAELGVCHSNFYRLVQAFKRANNAAAMPGAAAEKSSVRKDVESASFLDQVIAQNSGASETHIVRQIKAEAMLQGIKLPAHETLQRRIRKSVNARAPVEFTLGANYAVDFCVLQMPVCDSRGNVGRPTAALVVDIVGRKLAGLALSSGPPSLEMAAQALLSSISPASGTISSPSLVLSALNVKWQPLQEILEQAAFDVRFRRPIKTQHGKIALAGLGERIGNVRMRFGMVYSPLRDRPQALLSGERPMQIEEAEAFVMARERRSRGMTTLSIRSELHDELAQKLSELIPDRSTL